jgi:PAS domain-containing protein
VIADPPGSSLYHNPAFIKLTGYDVDKRQRGRRSSRFGHRAYIAIANPRSRSRRPAVAQKPYRFGDLAERIRQILSQPNRAES